METQTINPILCNTNQFSDGSKTIILSQFNVSKYFNSVYVLLNKTNERLPIEFYMKYIDGETLKNINSKLVIWKAPIDIIRNIKMFNRICITSKEKLQCFNNFDFELEEHNIVLPILNISFKNFTSYLNSNNNLESLYNFIVLSKYFNDDITSVKNIIKIKNIVKNMDDSLYWENKHNCGINLSKNFLNRKTDGIKQLEWKKQTEEKNQYNDYLNMSENTRTFKLSTYYKIDNDNKFSKLDINKLFETLDYNNQCLLFSYLLVSNKYYHLVINNEYILNLMHPELTLKSPLFRYLLSYTWLQLTLEENIKGRELKTTDNIIFTINSAKLLPVYPFSSKFPKLNPYMPLLISDDALNASENICGLKEFKYENNNCQNHGICTLEQFRERLNLFTTGDIKKNIFKDIEWSKLNIAVCGSIMSACIQYQHPLVHQFNEPDLHSNIKRFFNEMYVKSDVDIMFLKKDTFEYMKCVYEFHKQIVINTCELYSPYAESKHIKLQPMFQFNFCVNELWIDKNISNSNITSKYICENIESEDIKQLFEPYIEKMYNEILHNELLKYSEEERKNVKNEYPDFFSNIKNYQTNIHIYKNKGSNILYNVLKINYKYRITSPYLEHPFELFCVRDDDFMNCVSQFHLPCVRAYYDGNNVYMTPLCVSAHLTLMNYDYKYFASAVSPYKIINNYRMRGFGTWLNGNEIIDFLKYSTETPDWCNSYKSSGSLRGSLNLDNKIFQPRLYNAHLYYEHTPVTDNGYKNYKGKEIATKNEYFDEYYNKYKIKKTDINMNNFICVNENGNIEPIKTWIIEAHYNLDNPTLNTNPKVSMGRKNSNKNIMFGNIMLG